MPFLATRPALKIENGLTVESKLALLFPVDSNLPQLFWVSARLSIDEEGEGQSIIQHLEEHYMHFPEPGRFLNRNGLFQLFVGMNSMGDDPKNQCLLHLNAGWRDLDPGAFTLLDAYHGNLVVCALNLNEDEEIAYRDINHG